MRIVTISWSEIYALLNCGSGGGGISCCCFVFQEDWPKLHHKLVKFFWMDIEKPTSHMELLYGLSFSLSLSVWRKHLLWHFAQKLDSLSEHIFFPFALPFCSEIGLSLISLSLGEHICFTSGLTFCTEIGLSLSEKPSSHHFSNFAQKLGSLSERTHLLCNFAQNTDYKYS